MSPSRFSSHFLETYFKIDFPKMISRFSFDTFLFINRKLSCWLLLYVRSDDNKEKFLKNEVFSHTYVRRETCLVTELKIWRKKWKHLGTERSSTKRPRFSFHFFFRISLSYAWLQKGAHSSSSNQLQIKMSSLQTKNIQFNKIMESWKV